MRICITRAAKNAYSETFIHDQIRGISNHADVFTIYRGLYPERREDGSLLCPKLFWLLHKIVKVFVGRNNYFGNYGVERYFKQNKIEVVLANYGMSASYMVPVCKKLNIPLIAIFHGYDATEQRILKKYRKKYLEMFDYASGIIAVSGEMKQRLIKLGAKPEKVSLIPYGVDISKFNVANNCVGGIKFLAVGRFTSKKAPQVTIRAFNQVLQKYPDAILTMVGKKTGLYGACEKLVLELGIQNFVRFTGALGHQEVACLMKESLAFVQHSITAPNGDMEGTPLGILEASASGLPVVSTFHGGIKEAVLHQQTGFLVNENDEDSMAKFMIAICDDFEKARRMGLCGREHVEKNHQQMIQIKKIYQLAENLN